MENNNQLQEINPESKPILLKIIIWVSIILGLIILLGSMWLSISISLADDPLFSKSASERIMEVLRMVIAFALIFGGFGLLKMKKWGLYVFSVVALYFVIGTIFTTSWSAWRLFGIWVLILQVGIIIGGIFSLIYLWKRKSYFK